MVISNRISAGRWFGSFVALLIVILVTNISCPSSFAKAGTSDQIISDSRFTLNGFRDLFQGEDSGALKAVSTNGKVLGKCPLRHTTVSACISGYVARVTVTQVFENAFDKNIEAVYTFPLSSSAAVDEMFMKIDERIIHGTIKTREESHRIYEQAKQSGRLASLLDQERPNIFTQSVANIPAHKAVEVSLNYVEFLPYDSGSFTFAFPTVVGPRFIPGQTAGKQGTGWAQDTRAVPDASRITPYVLPKGTRAGHDISIDVTIDAGVPLQQIESKLHEVTMQRSGPSNALISLKDKDTIPNKDFVLSWRVASDQLHSGCLTYRNPSTKDRSGYFTLMLLPPQKVSPAKVAPKEMIFLIDQSGSQSGMPLEKAKESMYYILDHMNPQDTFQVIAFSDDALLLFDSPRQASSEMKAKAHAFISKLNANGGTWMASAVEKACSIPADAHRLRIVTFMTDGYVGNDFEILGMIRKLRGKSRWFPFGTGNGVNRMLIDGIAKEGGGEADYVLLNSSGEEVGKKFYDRIATPVLTDVKMDFGGLAVKEVFPKDVSDVWAEKPLYVQGRYTKPGEGTVTLSGYAAGKPYEQRLHVIFPEDNRANAVLSSIWARTKVDQLMGQDWLGAQQGSMNKTLKDEIVKIALEHHLMTQYTSFVAVDETPVGKGTPHRQIIIPVEIPDGVSATQCHSIDAGGSFNPPVDPRYGQSNEVGVMADFGYDTTRDLLRLTTVVCAIASTLAAARLIFKRKARGGKLIASILLLALFPVLVHVLGMVLINNYGGCCW